MTLQEQIDYLAKGCVDIVREPELRARLERSAASGEPLTVKVGFDPTAPDLHLGHTVLLRKMKHFQDLGHRVIFLIGDFTGLIGDPTGRSKTRPPLTREQIEENAETYKRQVFKLLDPDKTVVDFNSAWLRDLGAEGWIRLAARYNVAQMLERRDFRQRYDGGRPIAIHEFLYPLAQAYDSVHLRADVELGGTDQLFNLNVGRDIMPAWGVEPQVVMTTPLLVGLDGTEKMSKSAANYVGIAEPPGEMFGKLMSISDSLMWSYHELLTDLPFAEVEALKKRTAAGELHPKRVKVDLATRIVTDFHSAAAAGDAADAFERRFARREVPTDVEDFRARMKNDDRRLTSIMVAAELAKSRAAATRVIAQGGVRVDGVRVSDRFHMVPADHPPFVLQVGRRARRIRPFRPKV
ncbi:MAG: tyrosine--tRNA ligase [Acidobacteria bacterium]|nr:tyrosine--tRNA ligase [Acidobacteriota bacterium]